MIQVGGHDAFGLDYQIPLRYGIDQCIGDTLGPGGIFRGLRHIPILKHIAKDMEEVARPICVKLSKLLIEKDLQKSKIEQKMAFRFMHDSKQIICDRKNFNLLFIF